MPFRRGQGASARSVGLIASVFFNYEIDLDPDAWRG
jgi:hypothetical protein